MSTTQPRTVVALTGEDDRFARVRRRAGDLAATTRGTVLLYDIDAAGVFASPTATDWSGEGQAQFDRTRLGPNELEAHGRPAVADQVRSLRRLGIDAYGYLPDSVDGEDLAKYAEAQRADVILVPARLPQPGLLERLMGQDPASALGTTAIPVVPVE